MTARTAIAMRRGRAMAGYWPEALLVLGVAYLLVVMGGAALKPVKPPDTIQIIAGELPSQMDHEGKGREADILLAALHHGMPARAVEFHVAPFTRHWGAYRNDARYEARYDAVATVPATLKLDGYVSRPYIEYQNGVIYKTRNFPRGLGADPLGTLGARRLVAFAGASGILPGLQQRVTGFRSYSEYDDQSVQAVMLSQDFVDAVIADRLIVDEYDRRVLGADYVRGSAELAFDAVFCPTRYHVVFRTDEMRQAFDAGLAVIEGNGELDAINARYSQRAAIREDARRHLSCPP